MRDIAYWVAKIRKTVRKTTLMSVVCAACMTERRTIEVTLCMPVYGPIAMPLTGIAVEVHVVQTHESRIA